MAKKILQKLYDPKLTPEKTILIEKEQIFAEITGTNRILRSGEQYFMSCTCGAREISADENVVSNFYRQHYLVH